MRQELESVDFYISQGYSDIALDTLDVLEKQFGPHKELKSRRDKLTRSTAPAEAQPAVFEFNATEVDEPHEETVSLDMAFAPIESARNGLVAEVATPAKANAQKGIDSGLAELFEEFRVAEEEDTGLEDYETHYNMGLAYKEMELFEEALEEFQLAVRLVSADDGTPRYLQCCNLLGHCFLEKGVPQLAINWFNKGLNAPSATEDQRQALRFDLAAAHEQAGELNRAMDLFTEIYGVNVSYRGVNERLRSLQARMTQ